MNQWVLIIILIVVLILFGRPFLDIGRGISESLYNSFLLLVLNFKAGIRREPRQQDGDYRSFLLLVLALIAVAIILSVLSRMYFPPIKNSR